MSIPRVESLTESDRRIAAVRLELAERIEQLRNQYLAAVSSGRLPGAYEARGGRAGARD